jgi:hypothetical protein
VRKLCYQEFNNSCAPSNVILMIESRKIRWRYSRKSEGMNKTGNVRINVILLRVRVTTVAVKKP